MKPTFNLAEISAASGLEDFLKAYHADLVERYDWQPPNIGKALNIASKMLGYHSYKYYQVAVSGSGLSVYDFASTYKMDTIGIGHDFFHHSVGSCMVGPFSHLIDMGWDGYDKSGVKFWRTFNLSDDMKAYCDELKMLIEVNGGLFDVRVEATVDGSVVTILQGSIPATTKLSVLEDEMFFLTMTTWRDQLDGKKDESEIGTSILNKLDVDCPQWLRIKNRMEEISKAVSIGFTQMTVAFDPVYLSAVTSDWVDDHDDFTNRYKNFRHAVVSSDVNYESRRTNCTKVPMSLGSVDGVIAFLVGYHNALVSELGIKHLSEQKITSALKSVTGVSELNIVAGIRPEGATGKRNQICKEVCFEIDMVGRDSRKPTFWVKSVVVGGVYRYVDIHIESRIPFTDKNHHSKRLSVFSSVGKVYGAGEIQRIAAILVDDLVTIESPVLKAIGTVDDMAALLATMFKNLSEVNFGYSSAYHCMLDDSATKMVDTKIDKLAKDKRAELAQLIINLSMDRDFNRLDCWY
jgi:hypothetical protein